MTYRVWALGCLALWVAGCGPAPSEALVCDPAASDEVAFIAHSSDAFFGAYQPHGTRFLIVDGSCRYVVYDGFQGSGGMLRTGVLDATQLGELNADLLTQPWESLAGDRPPGGADGEVLTYRRRTHQVTCMSSCDEAITALGPATAMWTERLWASGTPVAGGVDVQVLAMSGEAPAGTPPWEGSSSLRPAEGNVLSVDDPDDVARLRALRAALGPFSGRTNQPPISLVDDGTWLLVGVVDRSPYPPLDLFSYQRTFFRPAL